jgi:nitrite reductase/ring-hydroxylating ferredoxin subunit
MQPGNLLHRVVDQTERLATLDKFAAPLARAADGAVRRTRLKPVLSGSWLGHPLHPLATDAVIGSWTMAALLDLRGGQDFERAARALVGVGILTAAPTAASGASDWADTPDARVRRVGIVHAACNVAALGLNVGSYVARRTGRRSAGARLTAASAVPLTIGGFLGAHMAYARGAGVSRTAFDERIPDWTSIEGSSSSGDWSEASVRGLRVLAHFGEAAERPRVVAARCTHCGSGLLVDESGVSLRCPADDSVFRVDDGAVLAGPAATPIPIFETRSGTSGGIEVRSPGAA